MLVSGAHFMPSTPPLRGAKATCHFLLTQCQDEWIKHGLSRRECELELAVQVPAGSETSTTAIRGIMLYLVSAPSVYRKLQQEISTGIEQGQISDPITQEEAKRMPYLQVSSSLLLLD